MYVFRGWGWRPLNLDPRRIFIYLGKSMQKNHRLDEYSEIPGQSKTKIVEILPSPVYQYKLCHMNMMALPLSLHFGIGEPPAARGFT